MSLQRRTYTTPSLTIYGTVRNLTGGSGTNGRDGDLTFTKNFRGGG